MKKKQNKFHVKAGDTVLVIAGDYKGTKGKIAKMLPEKNRAIVEGVNMMKKHIKPNQENPKGGILELEAPIHISNLKVVDAKGVATRVGRRKNASTGKLEKYSKKSGEVIK